MKCRRQRQRGVVLILVVMVMIVVAGLLTFLALNRSQYFRQRQAERVRITARSITDSAADYARVHMAEWSSNPPEKPVELDVSALLPAKMNGSAVVSILEIEGQKVCRVSSKATLGAYSVADEIDILFD